jgi:hypothetical protein
MASSSSFPIEIRIIARAVVKMIAIHGVRRVSCTRANGRGTIRSFANP